MKLASEHTCKYCNSSKVRAISIENLYHPYQGECIENDYSFSFDDEVFCELTCDDCKKNYSYAFAVVENLPISDESRIKYYENEIKRIQLTKFLAEPK